MGARTHDRVGAGTGRRAGRGGILAALTLTLTLTAALAGCPADPPPDEPGDDAGYTPPGGGVAKGCRDAVQFDEPLATGLGLSSHVEWRDDELSEARRAFEIEQWAAIGVVQVRRDLTWSILEPAPGEFDFTLADRTVEAAEAAGGEVIGLLVYGNTWACADCDDAKYPPDDPADFGAYAAAVAERYRGRVRSYEIWNEQNAGVRFWKPVEDPAGYAALLVEAADRIHEVDPDARVSLGGLFHPPMFLTTPGPEFLGQVFDARPDLAEHIDAVAFHPYRYPFTAPEEREAQESLTEAICGMAELLDARGAGALPLWITELGWHTAPDAFVTGVTEDEQAAYLVRSTLLSFAQGVPIYLWYTFRDSGTDPEDQEQMFGLYAFDADPLDDAPPRPKAAALAHATLSERLGSHDRIADRSVELGLDAETYAYELSGGDGTVIAVWRSAGEGAVLVPGDGDATLVGMTGESEPIAADGGAFTVSAGPRPVYLVLP